MAEEQAASQCTQRSCGWQRNSGASQELVSRTRLGTLVHSLEGEIRVPTQTRDRGLLDPRNCTYRSQT